MGSPLQNEAQRHWLNYPPPTTTTHTPTLTLNTKKIKKKKIQLTVTAYRREIIYWAHLDTQWSWETSVSISLGKSGNPIKVEIFQVAGANRWWSSPDDNAALIIRNLNPGFQGQNTYFSVERGSIYGEVIGCLHHGEKSKVEHNTGKTFHR